MSRWWTLATWTLAAVGALAIALALYVKTQPPALELHGQAVDRFAVLRTLDARIARETLATRHGATAHYDALGDAAGSFLAQTSELAQDLAPVASHSPELTAQLEQLARFAALRDDAVERFKTANSVLRNSLLHLPFAAERVSAELEVHASALARSGRQSAAQPLAEAQQTIALLVQGVLAQNLVDGQAELAQVGRQLERAAALEAWIPDAVRERYRLLLLHARTASRMQQEVDPLIRQGVLASAVGGALAELERSYGQHFDASLHEASLYRAVMYGWSTLLLLALLAAALELRSFYARLEQRVQERTRALDDALNELWGEMQLAKKIQTALLPRQLVLRDCEVAAAMRTTEQVGGDYYDVFEVEGVEWVLIGDVSGHGVPAGLVMMMCQTAVHSALAARPDLAPDELLAAINRTLKRNIEHLGEDKYMTISALRRGADGSFQVAGMHQDLLVYRARDGRVEHLPAQGTWLGIISDIRELNPVRRLELEPGDALVLYTDGITEARRGENMLDVAGLERAIAELGSQSAEHILAGILRTLEGYEVNDDVAAVIVKRRGRQGALSSTAA